MRLFVPLLVFVFIFQGCSYMDAVKRSKDNEKLKGTKAYYDNKCLLSEECATLSGAVYLPADDKSSTLALVTVLHDKNNTRVIDAQLLDFAEGKGSKVSYFFFSLPVGEYKFYVLKPGENKTFLDDELKILAEIGPTSILPKYLEEYHNAIVTKDINVDSNKISGHFPYALKYLHHKLVIKDNNGNGNGYFDEDVDLDDPGFSHKMAMEGSTIRRASDIR